MKKSNRSLVLLAAILSASVGVYAQEAVPVAQGSAAESVAPVAAQKTGPASQVSQDQAAKAKEYLASKRSVELSDRFKDGALTLGGEVALEYHKLSETRRDVKETSPDVSNAGNVANVAAKLMLDYKTENTWASIKLKFKNDVGQDAGQQQEKSKAAEETLVKTEDEKRRVGSGTKNKVSLDKAFFGFNLFESESSSLDVEIGRNQRESYFNSKLQFDSYQDGIALLAQKSFDKFGDGYATASVHMVDTGSRHAGFTGEAGLNHIYGSGLNLSYSFSNWKKSGKGAYNENATPKRKDNAMHHCYQISQFTASYDISEDLIKVPVSIYAAFLVNHAAQKEEKRAAATTPTVILESTEKKNNTGWYAGFVVGATKIKKKGDWQFESYLSYVGGQLIPFYDMPGIGPDRKSVV